MHEHRPLSCLLVVGANVAGIPAIAKPNFRSEGVKESVVDTRTDTHHGAIELDVIAMSVIHAYIEVLASPAQKNGCLDYRTVISSASAWKTSMSFWL